MTSSDEEMASAADEAKSPTLEESVVQSIALTDLRDAVTDVAELGLDQLLMEGPARDVPVLGTLVKLVSTIGLVRDHIFARKVAKFLLRVSEVPAHERADFVAGLQRPAELRRVGDALILILDRLDNMQKPDLLGLLFQAYLNGRVELSTFQRLSRALDRLDLAYMPMLRTLYESASPNPTEGIPHAVLQELASAGLVNIRFGGGLLFDSSFVPPGGFDRNELGSMFVELTARGTA